jgi:hypothetical protein
MKSPEPTYDAFLTVGKSLAHLTKMRIIKQLGENRRNRLFTYSRYLQILND